MKRPRTLAALELAGSLLLVLATARYLMLFFHRGANLLDEGSQVAMANRILHGDVIYRDFLTVATPGSFYTIAWLFQVFGAGLMVVRWTAFALNLGILLTTLTIARQLMSWPFAAASALLSVVWGWFLVAPNLYSLEAMFFALAALACYLRAVRRGESLDSPDGEGRSDQPPLKLRRSAEALRAKAEDLPLRSWLFLSGIACGAAMMVKQNTGVYAAIGLSLAMWGSLLLEPPSLKDVKRERWRLCRYFIAGIALVVIPTLLYLIAIGAGPHLYENWIYYPLQLYPRGLTFEYPSFSPLSASDIWQKLVLYLPWLVYPFAVATLVVFAVRQRWHADPASSSEAHALLAVTLFGALTFLQAFPRADFTHILFGMPPAFILLGYLCFTCSKLLRTPRVPVLGYAAKLRLKAPGNVRRLSLAAGSVVLPRSAGRDIFHRLRQTGFNVNDSGVRRCLAVVLCLLPLIVLLREGDNLTLAGYETEYIPLTTGRARGVRTNMRNAAQIDQVSAYLTAHTAPGDPIFVVPWAAGFYFLADRPNPTRFDVLLYGDPDVYPCLIATLDEHRPALIVYGYGWDVDGKRFSEYAQPIDRYIRTRYQLAERFDEYEIWRRLETAEPVRHDATNACRRRVLDSREYRRLVRQLF